MCVRFALLTVAVPTFMLEADWVSQVRPDLRFQLRNLDLHNRSIDQ